MGSGLTRGCRAQTFLPGYQSAVAIFQNPSESLCGFLSSPDVTTVNIVLIICTCDRSLSNWRPVTWERPQSPVGASLEAPDYYSTQDPREPDKKERQQPSHPIAKPLQERSPRRPEKKKVRPPSQPVAQPIQ
eukprot:1005808-Rhodomonas_salina.1